MSEQPASGPGNPFDPNSAYQAPAQDVPVPPPVVMPTCSVCGRVLEDNGEGGMRHVEYPEDGHEPVVA